MLRTCRLLSLVCSLLLCFQGCALTQSPEPPSRLSDGYAAVYGDDLGAVASVNPIATQAGLDAFAAGGNAIDAALAVAFTLGVVDSHNSGIGGGCFILARLASGEIIALDGREIAPALASPEMYVRDGRVAPELSRTGPLAVGIPGSVAALYQLHRRAGELRFADVLLPAADLAERGFPVDKTLAMRLESTVEDMRAFPATLEIFTNEQGEPLAAGQTLKQPDLAASYRALAKQGPLWFYRGDFAKRTAQWMQSHGGVITYADFANYRTREREPVKSDYLGYTIYGFPPPSSGGVHVAQMLNMLEQFNLPQMDPASRYHLLAEVMRRAFADRAYWLGDADFVAVPKGLSDESYAVELARTIDLQSRAPTVEHGTPPAAQSNLFNKHTTHIATADAEGNWVAVTTTLNTSFGSKVVIPGTGVLLNNQMDDFASQPGVPNAYGLVGAEANRIESGKRPLSSMSPTLVMLNDKPVLSVGAAGGPTIISQVLQTLVNYLALREPLPQAVASPRVHQQWRPDLLFVEPAIPAGVRSELEAKGHSLKDMGSFGGTQAITLENGRFVPVTEPRVIERNREAEVP